jgi:hypothetical protein
MCWESPVAWLALLLTTEVVLLAPSDAPPEGPELALANAGSVNAMLTANTAAPAERVMRPALLYGKTNLFSFVRLRG